MRKLLIPFLVLTTATLLAFSSPAAAAQNNGGGSGGLAPGQCKEPGHEQCAASCYIHNTTPNSQNKCLGQCYKYWCSGGNPSKTGKPPKGTGAAPIKNGKPVQAPPPKGSNPTSAAPITNGKPVQASPSGGGGGKLK